MNSSHCYIGQKGYTIPKKHVSPEIIESLRTELTLSPKESFAVKKVSKQESQIKIPVYRENAEKFYIPRFFGIEKFGIPPTSKLSTGDKIEVPFANQLRDYQEDIVKVYTDHIAQNPQGGGGILEVPCGRGKCLGKDTPILMYDGTIKKVQDVVEGDSLMGDDSTGRTVLSLARGREQMYRIHDKIHGESYVVNESHILSLKCSSSIVMDSKKYKKGKPIDICVKDFLELPEEMKQMSKQWRGYRVPIRFSHDVKTPLPIDPYVLGLWLGDRHATTNNIVVRDPNVLRTVREIFRTQSTSLYLQYDRMYWDYKICSCTETNDFIQFLQDFNLVYNKHIPMLYKTHSRETRLKILAGIIDSDGYCTDEGYNIFYKQKHLVEDILYVARSLGFVAYKHKKKRSYQAMNYIGYSVYSHTYRMKFYGPGMEHIPVQCSYKKHVNATTMLCNRGDPLQYAIEVEKLDEDEYYGFEIDGNRRFVLGDFTVTHNTIMALNIIHRLEKKTMILVHKEFLMNQWRERIRDFLPTARVGMIQGPKFDIEQKDIVIGMIQTIYSRDYKMDTFSSFGLTIIDEVHRIGSEEFSKTLTKIVTPCMLGISATVDRKDGLTDILYMFIGPKVYEEERKDEDIVQVRAIQYEDPRNIEFNTVEYDFRGNVKYSTMVSKISDYLPRSQFIIRILKDLIEEKDENQIMILSHKRDLLTYIHNEIQTNAIASCGYYVGGMKQKDLQETESKQIVLATYAMAAEALDIKTLNTLVMVSPKTDIIQSVGRILRTRGNGKIIVDIVDPHEVFQNQWKKRRTYYHKSNYQIRMIKSSEYTNMRVDWDHDTTWRVITNRRQPKPNGSVKKQGGSMLTQMICENDDDHVVETNKPACMIDLTNL